MTAAKRRTPDMGNYLEDTKKLCDATDRHYNCAQAVSVPHAENAGMTRDQMYSIASNFGAGMKMGSVCGALTGGLMVLGMYGLSDPVYTHKLEQEFMAKHDGMLDCRDLLSASAKKGVPRNVHCNGLKCEVAEAVEKILQDAGKIDGPIR
jgi:C_GCAxxG_C_C family probable redox protein